MIFTLYFTLYYSFARPCFLFQWAIMRLILFLNEKVIQTVAHRCCTFLVVACGGNPPPLESLRCCWLESFASVVLFILWKGAVLFFCGSCGGGRTHWNHCNVAECTSLQVLYFHHHPITCILLHESLNPLLHHI